MKPTPESAAVRPRVVQVAPVRGPGTAAVLLEEQIRAHCAAGRRGYVWIEGGPGAGKTTALAHLAAVLRDQPALALLDEPDRSELDAELNRGMLVVYASSGTAGVPHVTRYELVVWTADDWIEYLLARHRSECASVMARVRKAADVDLPAGNPELCAMILDELAADESIGDVTSALRRCLERVFAGRRAAIAARAALGMLAHTRTLESAELVQLSRRIGKPAMRLLRHAPVQRLLATDLAVRQFRAGKSCKWLAHRLPADLVTAVAAVIRADPEVQQHLAALFARRKPALQPMLASLLTAARPEWKPQPGEAISLAAAHLRGVQWAGVDLTGCSLQAADLRDADLRDARLDRARAERTLLAHAVLHGALLHELRAGFASLAGADLSCARARAGQFEGADLRGA
ncbi:MAG: pentapeptide repeat-containing protein, partial [Planctomycetota bacterium]